MNQTCRTEEQIAFCAGIVSGTPCRAVQTCLRHFQTCECRLNAASFARSEPVCYDIATVLSAWTFGQRRPVLRSRERCLPLSFVCVKFVNRRLRNDCDCLRGGIWTPMMLYLVHCAHLTSAQGPTFAHLLVFFNSTSRLHDACGSLSAGIWTPLMLYLARCSRV